jgi:hypothetical protein
MRLYSKGDLLELSGLCLGTINNWIVHGLLRPFGGGKGGCHRFTLAQLFAVFVGSRYRAEWADDGRIAGVVKYLSGLQMEWLEAEMEAGRTFPVPAGSLGRAARPNAWLPGMLVIPPYDDPELTPGALALMKRLDLAYLYRELLDRIDEPRPVRRGRGRARRPRKMAR